MELEPIGPTENIEVEPVTVPILGYTIKGKPVTTRIQFIGAQPAGAAMGLIRAQDERGNINHVVAMKYVDKCVHPDDREKFDELIDGKDVFVSTDTIVEVYVKLSTWYVDHPMTQRSGSRGGRGATKPTTRAAASSRASTKKVSA